MILLDTETISLLAAGHARVAARFISKADGKWLPTSGM